MSDISVCVNEVQEVVCQDQKMNNSRQIIVKKHVRA